MAQQPLWVPPNYGPPAARQFSLMGWIAGQCGIFMVARWVGLGCFVMAHLFKSLNQQDVEKIGQVGYQICLIMGSAWVQRKALTSKGLIIPYWLAAAGMYSMIPTVGLLLSHFPYSRGLVESIAFICFWLGLAVFQTVVLWKYHKRFATYWLLIVLGATLSVILLGFLFKLFLFDLLIIGIIYSIGTGVLVKHYRT